MLAKQKTFHAKQQYRRAKQRQDNQHLARLQNTATQNKTGQDFELFLTLLTGLQFFV